MPAYATAARQPERPQPTRIPREVNAPVSFGRGTDSALLDEFIRVLVDRLAEAVAARLADARSNVEPEWLDSRERPSSSVCIPTPSASSQPSAPSRRSKMVPAASCSSSGAT
jgi:hypothetical protein